MGNHSTKQSAPKDKVPFDPDTLAERYAGNGDFNLPPEISRDFLMGEVRAAGKERKRGVFYYPHILPLIQRIRNADPIISPYGQKTRTPVSLVY